MRGPPEQLSGTTVASIVVVVVECYCFLIIIIVVVPGPRRLVKNDTFVD